MFVFGVFVVWVDDLNFFSVDGIVVMVSVSFFNVYDNLDLCSEGSVIFVFWDEFDVLDFIIL